MQEERIMVLNMVGEGKITAEEGVQLIKALACSGDSGEKIKMAAKDVGNKISEMARVAEPKVKKVTKAAVTKTGEVVDELGKNIKDIINNKCKSKEDGCGCGCDSDEEYDFADYVSYEDEVTADDIESDIVVEPIEDDQK